MRAAKLTPAALQSAGAKRGFAELKLLTEWRAVVGERLAEICRPVKVSYGGRGPGLGATLVLTAEGARAPEVEMQKPSIIEQVNAFYGYRAVSRVAIDQSRAPMVAAARRGFADPAAVFAPKPPAPTPGIGDPRLALALARLGANVVAKTRKKKDDETGADAPGQE